MKEGFSGIPNGVHSAFVWGGNDKIYLNEDYWMFDPERKIAISKQISELYSGKMEGPISSRAVELVV